MATSIGAFLMKKPSSGAATMLAKVKTFPDLGGAPDALESTTCADPRHTFEKGLESADSLPFVANYKKEDYSAIKEISGINDYEIWLGGDLSEDGKTITPTGADGKYAVSGYIDVYVNGFDVNTILEMTITIIPTAGPVMVE